MSHNVYSKDVEKIDRRLPNYLIVIDKQTNFKDEPYQTIVSANSVRQALELVRTLKCVCTIFESVTSKGLSAKYLCDCSYGVI